MDSDLVLNVVVLTMGLLFIASIASIAAKKLRSPYTILLVVIGLILGWASGEVPALAPLTSFRLTPEIVFFVFLPALLFEAAFNLDAHKLLKNFIPIITLAVPGLLISTATIGAILHYALGLPLGVALLFGSLISATDPAAVVALFKEMGAPKRLGLLVEGESLFNDGTSLVVFKIILGAVLLGSFSAVTVANGIVDFVVVCAGGAAVGVMMGVFFSTIIDKVDNDRLVEITLTTILAHTTFLTADHVFGVSGVIATVAAGLTMGSYGRNKISPQVQEHMASFWEYFAYISNSLIFLLVGLSVDLHLFAAHLPAILWGAFAIIVARALGVFSLFPMIARLRQVEPINKKFQAVIFWGGLRGALAIAMAISIPAEVEQRELLLVLTLGVVIFTLLVNGLTVKPLMKVLGLDRYSLAETFERTKAELAGSEQVLAAVGRYAEREMIDERLLAAERIRYKSAIYSLRGELDIMRTSDGLFEKEDEARVVMRHALQLEKCRYLSLFEEGSLNEHNLREMLHSIEGQLDRLTEGREVSTHVHSHSIIIDAERAFFRHFTSAFHFIHTVRKWKTVQIASTYERAHARLVTSAAMLGELDKMKTDGTYSPRAVEMVKDFYREAEDLARRRSNDLSGLYPEYVEKVEVGILKRFCLTTELESFRDGYARGDVSEKVLTEKEDAVHRRLRKMSMRPVEALLISPEKLLKSVPFLATVEGRTIKDLSAGLRPSSYLPGEAVVKETDRGSSLFIIGRGEVEVVTATGSKNRSEVVLARLGAGDWFGEVALLKPRHRSATVRAATPCTILEIKKDAIMPLIDSTPEIMKQLTDTARRRVLGTVLAQSRLFAELSRAERDLVAELAVDTVVGEGEIVFTENRAEIMGEKRGEKMGENRGDAAQPTALHIVNEGVVEEVRAGAPVLALGPGSVIGEDRFLGGEDKFLGKGGAPSGSAFVAAVETKLYTIEAVKLKALLRDYPEMARKVVKG